MGPKQEYDVVILGGGIGGLATGALLAHEGYRILLLERYDRTGGYAHSFEVDGFSFCHQVQYLMGCEEGAPVARFLKRIGLQGEIGFNFLDPEAYDVVVGPGLRFEIPSTLDAFRDRLVERFPEESKSVVRYFRILDRVYSESHGYDKILSPWDVIQAPWRFPSVLSHMRRTVQSVFDELGFSPELRAVLAGQAGNLSAGPSEASFLMHAGMQVSYARCAAYPKKGMGHFIERITDVIRQAAGCRVVTGCEVKRLHRNGRMITAVETDQETFSGRIVVSNIDPQKTYSLTQPKPLLSTRSYEYSDAVFNLYLGFEGLDLRAHGFGRRNFWYHSDLDLDREFQALHENRFDKPWLFLSTPSLLADPGALCAPQRSSMTILTFVNYEHFRSVEKQGEVAYRSLCQNLTERFLDILEKDFIPEARRHIVMRHVESPAEVRRSLAPPRCNVYGARLTPASYNLMRTTRRTSLKNLFLVGATSCYPGVMPIVLGSMELANTILQKEGRAVRNRGEVASF